MEDWLRRWLFRGTLAVAMALASLVAVAPWLGGDEEGNERQRVLALFGRDTALRRTSLASAAGLIVTALVFFQPTARSPRPPSNTRTK